MGQRTVAEKAPRRRHRLLTVPSGVLWFLCIWLPGYRDCGVHHPMNDSPELIAMCCIGLLVIAVSWLMRGIRFERATAILCALPALAFAALAGTITFSGTAYIGMNLAFVSAAGIVLGCLVWEREARGKYETADYLLHAVIILMMFALVLTGVLSTWHPPPDNPVQAPYLGPT